jgi:hypothetical protein
MSTTLQPPYPTARHTDVASPLPLGLATEAPPSVADYVSPSPARKPGVEQPELNIPSSSVVGPFLCPGGTA